MLTMEEYLLEFHYIKFLCITKRLKEYVVLHFPRSGLHTSVADLVEGKVSGSVDVYFWTVPQPQ